MGALVSLGDHLPPAAWARAHATAARLQAREAATRAQRRAELAEWARQQRARAEANPSPVQPRLF